jgi:hypothetical protein
MVIIKQIGETCVSAERRWRGAVGYRLSAISQNVFKAFPLALAIFVAFSGSVKAAEHGGEAKGEGAADVKPFDPKLPRPFDLGEFDLKNFRPTHNEIANIRFSLQLVFPVGTTNETIEKLGGWRHRLRDQAITAVRTAEAKDLAEPTLTKVQKLILLRIKRMPLPEAPVGVYLTDFAVSSG